MVGAGWGLTGRCVLWHRHGHLRQARIPRQRAAHLGCGRRRARTAGSHGVRVPPLRIDIPLHRCLCVDQVAQSRRESGVSGRSEAAGDRPDARPRNHACPECSTANAGLRFREALAVVALLLPRCIRNPQTDGATESKTDTLQL